MNAPTVSIVDDDAAVRDSLGLLCESAALPVETFDCAEAFLASYRPERTGCLILDVRMPGMTGPQLHQELLRRGCQLPVIYLTAHGDIPMTVRAIKAGAADFLTKPVDGALLVDRVQAALASDQEIRSRDAALAGKRARLAALTERERQIMAFAVAGECSKVIARRLGIGYRTVEVYRSRILLKTGTRSALELGKLVADCGLSVKPVSRARSGP